MMKIIRGSIPGLVILEPIVYRDERGLFLESFNAARFGEAGLPVDFVQDNHSRSKRGVLRGLHYQINRPQGKLVTVVRGEVFDVAVDIRRESPTFGKWHGMILSETRPTLFWIPPGFAHGFCVLSDEADFLYKCTDFYSPANERAIRWNDPTLGIDWPLGSPSLSPKDSVAPDFAEADLPPHYEESQLPHG
jgi:dTDP-4-dehydrorhamnose 3,5-epimerase